MVIATPTVSHKTSQPHSLECVSTNEQIIVWRRVNEPMKKCAWIYRNVPVKVEIITLPSIIGCMLDFFF